LTDDPSLIFSLIVFLFCRYATPLEIVVLYGTQLFAEKTEVGRAEWVPVQEAAAREEI
jgi:hypothetical protein